MADRQQGGRTQPNPGDEAAPGTPGTAEDVCPACHGSGRLQGQQCEKCGGSGRITRGIGGA
jgi:DnaJ-class molecular chaperone